MTEVPKTREKGKMNRTIKKSILLILIAAMLVASSMSITGVHAQGKSPFIYFVPPIDSLATYYGSYNPPTSFGYPPPGEGGGVGTEVQPAILGSSIPYREYPLPNIAPPYPYLYYYVLYFPGQVISGRVEVFVPYDYTCMSRDQQKHLRLCIYDPVDFNYDGTVNAQDIVLIVKAIQSGSSDPKFDINHDGLVNCADLLIVAQFATRGLLANQGGGCSGWVRLPWMDITAGVDLVRHYVYGFTDHFSGFGVH